MTREGARWRLYRDTARSQAHDMAGLARGAQAAWARGRWGAERQGRGSRLGARPGRAIGPAGCALSLF